MYKTLKRCRICGGSDLDCVLDLGEQMLTGVFPRSVSEEITSGPMTLVKCDAMKGGCGLLQLGGSYELTEMYGENYGYRSGLNSSMVNHLKDKVNKILSLIDLDDGDLVVDIGSNDGTTLSAYPDNLTLVGVDPSGTKFLEYYPEYVKLVPEFFSSTLIQNAYPGKQAKVVTSFSMFYDLEEPMKFMREVYDVLDKEGIWIFEQSYLPTMLEMNSFDTVCQEHLEYYCLEQIIWMANRVGFVIEDVEFNSINGGSFSVVARKTDSGKHAASVGEILKREIDLGLSSLAPYLEFAKRVEQVRSNLRTFIADIKSKGELVCGLGASTKGNVLLQYCGLTVNDIPYIGEVNIDKFGCFTPGSNIPIIPETEVLAMKPDYLLVLPWHFRQFFEESKKYSNCRLVFPLPELTIV